MNADKHKVRDKRVQIGVCKQSNTSYLHSGNVCSDSGKVSTPKGLYQKHFLMYKEEYIPQARIAQKVMHKKYI